MKQVDQGNMEFTIQFESLVSIFAQFGSCTELYNLISSHTCAIRDRKGLYMYIQI